MNKTIEVIKDIRTLCTHIFEGGHRCASARPPARSLLATTTTPPASRPTTQPGAAVAVNPLASNSPPANRTCNTLSTK